MVILRECKDGQETNPTRLLYVCFLLVINKYSVQLIFLQGLKAFNLC